MTHVTRKNVHTLKKLLYEHYSELVRISLFKLIRSHWQKSKFFFPHVSVNKLFKLFSLNEIFSYFNQAKL